jgi:translation initiation factor 1A
MPKGDKSRKNGASREVKKDIKEPPILSKDVDGTVYGHVIRILGDCNFSVACFDGKERMCHIRNSVKKGYNRRIELDSIVLVGLRDFQDGKGDIVYMYSKDQVADLKAQKEIPSKIASVTGVDGILNEGNNQNDDNNDTGFDFEAI